MAEDRRGIVIMPSLVPANQTPTSFQLAAGFNPVLLRHWLLFWDNLDYPVAEEVNLFPSNPHLDFLEQEGALIRTRVQYEKTPIGESLLPYRTYTQIGALQHHIQLRDGHWSTTPPTRAATVHMLMLQVRRSAIRMHTASESGQQQNIRLATNPFTTKRTIDIELYNAIPFLDKEVSLESILQFKQRRHNELLRFRFAMDELYEEIISSPDLPRTKTRVIGQLENRITDLIRVVGESGLRAWLGNLKVSINPLAIAQSLVAGSTTAAASNVLGLDGVSAVLAGAAMAGIGVSWQLAQVPRGLPPELKDYAYLASIRDELS